ncbi:hypothetical protein FGG78_31320 [Thioclava sp. BHET1]|nr:hypothetical protein FGG78_31320 [Thioclava sp. BHET1]
MSLTLPYPLAFLSDQLPVAKVICSILRNDEISAAGDGSYWGARLADPIWQASVSFHALYAAQARRITAKINALDGMSKTFLLADPSCRGPASDPLGKVVAARSVKIAAINADRTGVTFGGLSQGYQLSAGDRFTVVSGDLVYMGEISDDGVAGSSGQVSLPIWPPLWDGLATGLLVRFQQPYFKAAIKPAAFSGWAAVPGLMADGGSIDVIQKV